MSQRCCGALWAVGVAAGSLLVLAPLVGWPPVVRVHAVLLAAALLAIGVCHHALAHVTTADHWSPSAGAIWVGAVLTGLLLFWVVLTRFNSGEINAIDFTVYFDRPCFQTVQGRPWLVETAGQQEFSWRSSLYHHAYWAMLPICSLYALHPTPLWLLAISVVAVVAGAVYVLRIVQALGAGWVLATATAMAFVLNEHTAGTLSYGFHPEVLYAWFVPWAIYAALQSSYWQFLVAVLCAVLVKEDAIFPLFAVSMAIGLKRFRQLSGPERALILVLPVAIAAVNLVVFHGFVAPAYSPNGLPANAGFWQSYGPTPLAVAIGMVSQPEQVFTQVIQSPFFTKILLTLLYLPVIGWRWTVGILPVVIIYSASDFPQLRAFGLYYLIPVVPFLVIGASRGALIVARRITPATWNPSFTATALLLPVMFAGGFDRGYSLRPWRIETSSIADALSRLSQEPVVLVQSSLYPHAGYDTRVRLLTHHTLSDPRNIGAAVLIGGGMVSFPIEAEEMAQVECLSPIRDMPGGLRAVRLEHHAGAACPAPAVPRDRRSRQ